MRIEYRIVYDTGEATSESVVEITAGTIEAGFRKAVAFALKPGDKPAGWTIHSVEFWRVTS